MCFESLAAAQAYLDSWEERWADTRIHGTTKRQVAAMFAAERPHLQPLPLEPFRSYEYGTRTVHLDGHVEVVRAYYSVPPGHVGRGVWVQWDAHRVRILAAPTGQLLREHVRQQPGRHRTAREDRPAPTPTRLDELLTRAARAGKHIGLVCQLIFERERDLGSRRILGVLALARRRGPAAVEDACAAALDVGMPTYRFVRRYVERRSAPPLTLKPLRQGAGAVMAVAEERTHVGMVGWAHVAALDQQQGAESIAAGTGASIGDGERVAANAARAPSKWRFAVGVISISPHQRTAAQRRSPPLGTRYGASSTTTGPLWQRPRGAKAPW